MINDPAPGTGGFTLLPNGDFESGGTGWTVFSNGGRGTFGVTASEVFEGGASAESFSNTFSGPGFAYFQMIGGLTPGTPYVLSGFRLIDAAPGVQGYIDIGDAAGDPNLFLGEPRNPGGGWQFGYDTFIAPASSVTIRLVQDFGGGTSTPADKVYFDNIGVTPAGSFVAPIPEPVRGALALAGLCAGVLARRRR